MIKKVILPLLAAVLITVSFNGKAFAAEDDQPEIINAKGEVIEVDHAAGKFRLKTREGELLSLFTDENTHYRGKVENLDDLQVGWKAGVRARVDENGKNWAVLVIAGDGSEIIKARGEVTQVDPTAGKFRIKNPEGNIMTFFVDENTSYTGQITGLEELQVGWQAGVAAKEAEEDKLLAIAVVAGDAPELVKAKGSVTSVNASAGKFEIETSDGRTLNFIVDEKTRYQGQLSSLEGMQVGWYAGVAAKEGDNGKFTAVMVIAGIRPEQVRAKGIIKVVNPGAGKFQLEKPDGTVLTIFVDENTHYRGQVESFQDLEKGMRAGTVSLEQADGTLLARLVIAGNPKSERPPADKPDPGSEAPLDPRPYDNLSFPSGADL